ncbi:MAG TPA: ATP-binding protein [Steroidobacteraceae bacterium]|jgi:two-component system OmpR family sensor kinase/two-component system sensor histidine kinase QseC|nr:ATP-binding protein [Steroidobacteraceae bacterium]
MRFPVASIRTRLMLALLGLVVGVSVLAGALTYRRVLIETSTLFDYQLRQMALSLSNQVSLAPRLELPPNQADTDFVVQIWDPLGVVTYVSRPGLPIIDRPLVGYADLRLQGAPWRVYGLQTFAGVIQIAQPIRVRQVLARAAALRVVIPLLVLLPLLALAMAWVVRGGLLPLRRVASEVKRRDVHSLAPLSAARLPEEIAPLVFELNRLLMRLDAAVSAQRAFTADAAHELRSPLTAVRLQLQLLDRAPDEPARQQARADLGAAIERAIHLIEQLLTLARNEPPDARGAMEPLVLEAPAADAVADMHALALTRGIDLGLASSGAAEVRGNREALRILVRNLVDNAVRYTPAGGRVQVRISPGSAAGEGAGGALLEITDTGPGIPAAERARVFDRFYRRTGAPQGGCGLGLAIVKAIAERHGARVWLEDAPGGGLQVAVAFPRPP